jgi:hypothetical protein
MRVLEITDGRGGLLPDAWPRILSVLLYPEDQQACSDLHASIVSRALVEEGYQDQELKRHARLYGKRWDKALPRYALALTAGELLLLVLNLAAHSPPEATLRRAMHLYQCDRRGGRTYEGKLISVSSRLLWAAWGGFRNVAHLVAAWTLVQPPNESGLAAGLCVELPDVPQLLANAELLCVMGAVHHPPIGRARAVPGPNPLLDPDRTWRPPADLVLPKVKIAIPELTDFARQELNKYQKE